MAYSCLSWRPNDVPPGRPPRTESRRPHGEKRIAVDFFTALTEYTYLQRALVTAVVVGALCGTVGAFAVLRGLALMGDAISHAVLPGIAASFAMGISFVPGALVAGLLSAAGIGYVQQHSRLRADVAIGIVFTAMFALGVVLMTVFPSGTDLTKILFGNVLAVRPAELWSTVGVAAVVVLTILALFKELQVSSFDPVMAAAYGLPVTKLHYLVMTLLTVTTVVSLQTVGVVLVVAMLVTPAATAYLLTEHLGRMIAASALTGSISALLGLYASYRFNLPSGAVIVLAGAALFIAALLFAPRQGVVTGRLTARRGRARSATASV